MSNPIHDGWTVRPTAGPVPEGLLRAFPAQVPGSVHTDLLAAGAIGDPYLDANEHALAWMHDVDWRYERALTLEPAADDERVDLAFDGLDTVATVAGTPCSTWCRRRPRRCASTRGTAGRWSVRPGHGGCLPTTCRCCSWCSRARLRDGPRSRR